MARHGSHTIEAPYYYVDSVMFYFMKFQFIIKKICESDPFNAAITSSLTH